MWKDIYDSKIETMLNFKGKMNDGVNVCLRWMNVGSYDYKIMINKHVCPQHVIHKWEKKFGCLWVVRVSQRYFKKIKNMVSKGIHKLNSLQS